MKIKVCGLKHPHNINDLTALNPDFAGFIFYEKSSRFVAETGCTALLPKHTKKIGVFVNENTEKIIETAAKHNLDGIQLHGNENVEDCKRIREKGFLTIKAFNVENTTDFEHTKPYENAVDFFLFDTKAISPTPLSDCVHGGTGQKFDWNILQSYNGATPFFLSGGICENDAEEIKSLHLPTLYAVDINSRFEIEPGLKDIQKIEKFITYLRMNRIDTLFTEKTEKTEKIVSVYFTAGFPKLDDTCTVLRELQTQGIDMVEIGIPFSDPMADGVVIQQAAQTALNNGMTLALLFEQLHTVRPAITMPIILMGYLNPIMQYGFENFCKSCVAVGVDGVIIPDLPFADYMQSYKAIAEQYGIRVIMLITPETSEERVRLIDEHTKGFIYMVSSAATTGAQQSFDNKKQEYFKRIDAMNLHNPRLVGFGVSNKATFDAAISHASGAIVGSKFVQLLEQSASIKQAVRQLIEDLGK